MGTQPKASDLMSRLTHERRVRVSPLSSRKAIRLCTFLGIFGAHRFYVGRTRSAFAQLATLGGLGLWAWSDRQALRAGRFRDAEGRWVINWE